MKKVRYADPEMERIRQGGRYGLFDIVHSAEGYKYAYIGRGHTVWRRDYQLKLNINNT